MRGGFRLHAQNGLAACPVKQGFVTLHAPAEKAVERAEDALEVVLGDHHAAGDERGYATSKVLTMHTVSYNAEFYAAGRLLRDKDGEQKKLYGVSEVLNVIELDGVKPALVLVPLEYLHQLTLAQNLKSEVLKDNNELAIVAVSAK